VELVEIHRQAMSSGSPQIADTVRHGAAPRLPDFAGRAYGVTLSTLRMMPWTTCCGFSRPGWVSDDVQTLGVVKRGANGIRAINATMHAYAAAAKKKLRDEISPREGRSFIYE
jgi:exodeoxyribonuclease V alpha subunit